MGRLLDKYADEGADDIEDIKVLQVQPMMKLGTPMVEEPPPAPVVLPAEPTPIELPENVACALPTTHWRGTRDFTEIRVRGGVGVRFWCSRADQASVRVFYTMPQTLEQGPLGNFGLGGSSLDSPYLLPDGSLGILILSLRGKGVARLLSPSEIGWPRELPERWSNAPTWVILRRGDDGLVLGRARALRRGKRAEGFRVLLQLEEPMPEALWNTLSAEADAAPPPHAAELVCALTEQSTVSERLAALRLFVQRWYGIPDAAATASSLAPEPLRALRSMLGDRRAELFPQNDLVEPTLGNGKVIFYVENQGCCTWATESDGEDPPVYVRFEEDWKVESPSLSAFLIQMVMLEATLQAPWSANHPSLSLPALERLVKQLPELPMPAWKASGTRFFAGGGVIGFSVEGGIGIPMASASERAVWLGAQDRTCFEPIERLIRSWPELNI